MRLYAAAVVVMASATIVGFRGASASADTTNNTNNNNPVSAQTRTSVTVRSGDTLSAIAAANSTTYLRIFDANPKIQNPDLIYPGEVLKIPGANEQLPDRVTEQSSDTDTVNVSASATPQQVDPTSSAAALESQSQTTTPTMSTGSIWDSLARCESGGDWSINTGNGFYGGLQFTLSSWQSVGGTGLPNQASRDEQIMRAQMLQARQGWGAWPVCSAALGL